MAKRLVRQKESTLVNLCCAGTHTDIQTGLIFFTSTIEVASKWLKPSSFKADELCRGVGQRQFSIWELIHFGGRRCFICYHTISSCGWECVCNSSHAHRCHQSEILRYINTAANSVPFVKFLSVWHSGLVFLNFRLDKCHGSLYPMLMQFRWECRVGAATREQRYLGPFSLWEKSSSGCQDVDM